MELLVDNLMDIEKLIYLEKEDVLLFGYVKTLKMDQELL
jgi:hypothetical protein